MRSVRDTQRAVRWFHALSDATRLRIVDRLIDGEQCVCVLMGELGVSQSRLSFHLKTLKEAGILRDRRQGRWIYYSLNPESIEAMERVARILKAGSRGGRSAAEKCC